MIYRKDTSNIPLYGFINLSKLTGVMHYVTTRDGGVSSGPYESLNLSINVGDNPDYVRFNRFKLAGELGIHRERLVFPGQVHSDNIKVIDSSYLMLTNIRKKNFLDETDALITKEPFVCLSVLVADCTPVLFYDKKKKIIAVAHSGWQGSLSNIAGKTVKKLLTDFDCTPANIYAGIGPSISPENYTIKRDVAGLFLNTYENIKDEFIKRNSDDKYLLDLWTLIKLQIEKEGVPGENIEMPGLCTFKNHDRFFSHRRSKGKTGRFAAGIMLK